MLVRCLRGVDAGRLRGGVKKLKGGGEWSGAEWRGSLRKDKTQGQSHSW